MPQSLCSLPTRTKPQTTLLRSEDIVVFSSVPDKQIMHNSTTIATNDSKGTAEFAPVQIGTRGTVASLIMQEIDYFSRIKSNRSKSQITEVGSSVSTNSRATTIVSTAESMKKKRTSSSKLLLPSICSMVDVSNSNRPNGTTSSFSYRNLKSETQHFQV
ncbi:hypothetical protein PIB30_013325 [Stylosanthes scabra]|uniref:Uncharacterized protein n=1 Tax=Stylosanthes scabra TaxID=79078 RepID=A0ABU6U7V9_9FABA|nr:hypothetical protein [Stylosanthes scabra]